MWNLFRKNVADKSIKNNASVNTRIRLKNTLTEEKDVFKPVEKGHVSMYHCGPTVYKEQHIGNMRAFVFADLLGRLFRYQGLDVKQVINITDVGHLVSDNDEGEDKMEQSARETGLTANEISEKYTQLFMVDMKKLNIETSKIKFPRATDHIKEQIEIIEKLDVKAITYKTSDGIYFDTSKTNYGVLGNVVIENQEEGARVEKNSEKRNPTDFALWKFSKPGENRQQEWDSPWGIGFPGWHLECSAMSHKLLGDKFDIHTGGIEHIQIHHNNEIAQSFEAFGQVPANYWMHNGHVLYNKEKMSKSIGNVVLLSDIEGREIDPIVYRYWLLTSRYSTLTNFTWVALESAQIAYNRIINHFNDIVAGEINEKYLGRAVANFNDDLDTAGTISTIWEMIKDTEISKEDQFTTLLEIDKLLGLNFKEKIMENTRNKENKEIPLKIHELAIERQNMRKSGDYEGADKIRDQVLGSGFKIVDDGENFEIFWK
jgi:cysteinyl-tRNA synthetase